MVWQTIKNVFGFRTDVKQQRKKPISKTPSKVNTPGSRAKATISRKKRQSSSGKKKVVPVSALSVRSLVDEEDVDFIPRVRTNPILISETNGRSRSFTYHFAHSRDSNTEQEKIDRHPHTNPGDEYKSWEQTTLLSILEPLEHRHPESATLMYRNLLQVLADHIQLATSLTSLEATNVVNDEQARELHRIILELQELINSLNAVEDRQPAHTAQQQTRAISNHTKTQRSARTSSAFTTDNPDNITSHFNSNLKPSIQASRQQTRVTLSDPIILVTLSAAIAIAVSRNDI